MANIATQASSVGTAAHGHTINGYVYTTVTVGTGAYIGPLSITSEGSIFPEESFGAIGLILASASTVATVTNSGEIQGSGGAPNYGGSAYGNGGNAVDLDSAFSFTNKGRIFGGSGGSDSAGDEVNAPAGNGAVGVSISASGTLTNAGIIDGGNGGYGYKYAGGKAGVGVAFSTSAMLINSGTITGGAGGRTGRDYAYPQAGGYGIDATSGDTIKNTGMIVGGIGLSAKSISQYFYRLQGAAGGIGIRIEGGSLNNGGTIAGGAGGAGYNYVGGAGGAGVYLLASATGTNTGTIRGGSGYDGNGFRTGGGTGVLVDTHASLANSGTIEGGGELLKSAFYTGGTGLEVAGQATASNTGVITGGTDAYGGTGVLVTGGSTVNNSGAINGGLALSFTAGTGLQISGGSTASNSGTIHGGPGIASKYGDAEFGAIGGNGVEVYGAQFTNTGKIYGGTAGSTLGFYKYASEINATGGDGLNAGSGGIVANAGIITGGAGGNILVNGGTAGTGGLGVSLTDGTFTNTGTIIGGAGGYVPQSKYNNAIGGLGGAGAFVGAGATLVNDKLIKGGAGGSNIYTGNTGGAGVIISGGVFTNAGTVAGGAGGSSQVAGAMGDAVSFAAAGTLVAAAGAKFTGNVVSTLTSGSELELTGTSTTALAGIGTQFIGINLISFATGAARVLEGSLGFAPGATTPSPEIAGFAAHDTLVLDGWSCAPAKTTINVTPNYTQIEFQNSVKQFTIVNMPDLIATDLEVTQGGGKTTLTGLGTAATTLGSGAAEFVRLGGTGTGTIGKGATEQILSGGTVTATTIAGGDLILDISASSTGTISFSGTGGILDVESTTMPNATIASFVSGDTIRLDGITYSSEDTVTVATAGTVTIVTPSMSYKLKIAGATVGETDFRFGTGGVLTKAASPKAVMAFLAPPAAMHAQTSGLVTHDAGRLPSPMVHDLPALQGHGFTLATPEDAGLKLGAGAADFSGAAKLRVAEMVLVRHAHILF